MFYAWLKIINTYVEILNSFTKEWDTKEDSMHLEELETFQI